MPLHRPAAAIAAISMLAWATPAHATSEPAWPIAVYAGDAAVALVGVTMALHNGIIRGMDQRPSTGAIVCGYVFGGLNVAAGIVSIALNISTEPYATPVLYGIGGAHAAIGGAAIGLTAWSTTAPTPSRVALSPIAARDVGGRLVPGLTVTLGGF